jgi:hypothetical protein
MVRQISFKNMSEAQLEAELSATYEYLNLSADDVRALSEMLHQQAGNMFYPAIRQDNRDTATAIINELILNLKNSGHLSDFVALIEGNVVPQVKDVLRDDYFLFKNDISFSSGISRSRIRVEFLETPVNELTTAQLKQGMLSFSKFGKKIAAQLFAVRLMYEAIQRLSPKAPASAPGDHIQAARARGPFNACKGPIS